MGSIREFKADSIRTPIYTALEVLLEVFIPLLMAKLIDLGIDDRDIHQLLKYGLILLVCAMFSLLFGTLAGASAAKASAGFARNLRHDVYHSVQNFSFSNIDKFSTGSLVTRLTNDVTQLQNFINISYKNAPPVPSYWIRKNCVFY